MDLSGSINFVFLLEKILFFLFNAVGLQLIFWVYAANKNIRSAKIFPAIFLGLVLWLDIDFISKQAWLFLPQEAAYQAAMWSWRAMYALLAVFWCGFYIFCLNYPVRNVLDKKRAIRENLQIAVWTFFAAAAFTPFISKEALINGVPALIPGILFWPYAMAAALTFTASFANLSRQRRFADPGNRRKAKFAALGAGVFGIYNLILNIAAPAWFGGMSVDGQFAFFANLAVAIFLAHIVYRAEIDRLFGIKAVLVEIFIGLMGVSLAMMPFFVGFLWQKAILATLFLIFCVFGYLLAKSTIKEYREKEFLEKKVEERTKQLEEIKRNLEEVNSALEVRVRARTKELEELNQTLEKKVTERTKDLESKIKDLETFRKITVSRELKMIELKQEIEHLRADLAKFAPAAEKND